MPSRQAKMNDVPAVECFIGKYSRETFVEAIELVTSEISGPQSFIGAYSD